MPALPTCECVKGLSLMDKVDAIYCALLASSGANPFNQSLNTTDAVTFSLVTATILIATDSISSQGNVDIQGTLTFSTVGALGQPPVADGDYTVGIGGSQNGVITTRNGVITAVQEATP